MRSTIDRHHFEGSEQIQLEPGPKRARITLAGPGSCAIWADGVPIHAAIGNMSQWVDLGDAEMITFKASRSTDRWGVAMDIRYLQGTEPLDDDDPWTPPPKTTAMGRMAAALRKQTAAVRESFDTDLSELWTIDEDDEPPWEDDPVEAHEDWLARQEPEEPEQPTEEPAPNPEPADEPTPEEEPK